MLTAIDETPVTRQQKLRLFKHGVCPRLSWPLVVEDFPITWLERHLQPLATKALKKWAGLTSSSNTSILFLPAKKGGLAIPSLVSLHKKLQVTKMVQLLTSRDPGVRKAANLRLAEEEARQRLKFRPAAMVNSILTQEPSKSRRALTGAAKTFLAEEEDEERHQALCQLPAQGEMARVWGNTCSSQVLWARAVQDLPPEPMSFVLCASLDSLPTNANLHKWGKKPTAACHLCRGARQTLLHVLNNCPMAMELRRYSMRHDTVLEIIADFIRSHLPSNFFITIDSPSEPYRFPHHIIPTNLRPDMVWWSDKKRELWLFELTVSYEPLVADARARKRAKYHDLVEAGSAAGYRTELITVEVGSRGMLGDSVFEGLKEATNASTKDISTLCLQTIRAAILGSFAIWTSWNSIT